MHLEIVPWWANASIYRDILQYDKLWLIDPLNDVLNEVLGIDDKIEQRVEMF